MARRGLGGSDFSSTFASLYSFNKDQATAQQAADDADAQDRWANGLMSDDEWLSYISQRITATAGKPKDQEKWITAQRKYSSAIADQQAESAYQNGGSINQLISYYQQKLGAMVKDSNEYRDTQGHLNDLLDKRSGDQLSDQATQLVDEINKGTKTYADLKKLLSTALADARDNSSLKKSIQDQLHQVNETIRTNALEGSFEKLQYQYDSKQLSGGSYAKRLRSMAVQFKQNDPKRYYQILEAATQLEKNPGLAGSGGGGGRRGGGGGGGGSRRTGTKAINASIDTLQARRQNIEGLVKQYDDGATRGVDPSTGQVVVFSPEMMTKLDHDYLKVEDQLSAAYLAKGDKSAAATAQKYKAIYISTKIVNHNTVAADDQSRELMTSTSKLLDHALSNPDPTSAMNQVKSVAKQWSDFAKGLTNHVTKTTIVDDSRGGRNDNFQVATGFGSPKGILEQVDPALVSNAQAFSGALATLSTPGVDDASAQAAMEQLQAITAGVTPGGDPKSNAFVALGGKALEVNARQQGLATGDLVRIATPDGLSWVRTETIGMDVPSPTDPSQLVHIERKVPNNDDLKVDGKKTKLVDVFVDINGTPTKMQAVASLTTPQGMDTWVASGNDQALGLLDKHLITDAQVAKLVKKYGSLKNAADAGKIELGAAFSAWTVTIPSGTDANGKARATETWTMDPRTNVWYQGTLPVRGVQRRDDGTVAVNPDGSLGIDWKAFGSESGAPAPYAGANGKAMQDLLNNGAVDVSSIKATDALGQVDPSRQPDFAQSYWGPKQAGVTSVDSWWKDDIQSQKSKDALLQHNQIGGTVGGLSPDERQHRNDDFAAALGGAVKNLASQFGINLDGTQDRRAAFGGQSPDARSETKAALSTFMSKKTKDDSALPTIALPKARSGPVVTQLGDLDLRPSAKSIPKVVIPAQRRATTKKAPAKTVTKPYGGTSSAKTGKDDVYTPPPVSRPTGPVRV